MRVMEYDRRAAVENFHYFVTQGVDIYVRERMHDKDPETKSMDPRGFPEQYTGC